MVGVVKGANDTRMDVKQQGEMGRDGRKQWRSRKNSVGNLARNGKVHLQC